MKDSAGNGLKSAYNVRYPIDTPTCVAVLVKDGLSDAVPVLDIDGNAVVEAVPV